MQRETFINWNHEDGIQGKNDTTIQTLQKLYSSTNLTYAGFRSLNYLLLDTFLPFLFSMNRVNRHNLSKYGYVVRN